MSFIKSVPYSPAIGPCTTSDSTLYPEFYTCGPGGETFYVYESYTPDSSEINSPPPVNSPENGLVTTRLEAGSVPPVKKRRVTANKKERRRTLSINLAFMNLRKCIPNVPVDTKLSKIKTLRLAISYIGHLCQILEEGKSGVFQADFGKCSEVINGRQKNADMASPTTSNANERRTSGRTGWPQHVWALELKTENPS
ncbi:heart- and neural crest derivatives-expressed protein 2 [Parasteatoda tepidariorum]|uniref:heart- and neural crest derivatives-expressed protein 2 n=1 Tax=Parasteatoda tepidariorum TaxID=114398 RepID=UPI00077FBF42|nr:heart- and neural crest derivatives-expressed protein 2 [Parasteatoda tepidariorum]